MSELLAAISDVVGDIYEAGCNSASWTSSKTLLPYCA